MKQWDCAQCLWEDGCKSALDLNIKDAAVCDYFTPLDEDAAAEAFYLQELSERAAIYDVFAKEYSDGNEREIC